MMVWDDIKGPTSQWLSTEYNALVAYLKDRIKGILVDDTDKADGRVLVYRAATDTLQYEDQAGGGGGGMEQHANEWHTPDMALQSDYAAHKNRHKSGGADPFAVADLLDGVARIKVRKNTGLADVGIRRRLNFVEGTGVTLTVTDDAANEEVKIQIGCDSVGYYDRKTSDEIVYYKGGGVAPHAATIRFQFDATAPFAVEQMEAHVCRNADAAEASVGTTYAYIDAEVPQGGTDYILIYAAFRGTRADGADTKDSAVAGFSTYMSNSRFYGRTGDGSAAGTSDFYLSLKGGEYTA